VSRRTLINLIYFNGVFALMLLWAFNNIVSWDRIEQPYRITGDFEQAAGVRADAEVTYLGVHYGRVSSVERRDDGVRVTMKIDKGKEIPAGSVARVFRKSAIGEPYVDFVPPDSYQRGGTEVIEAGDNVPLSRTTVPLEFSELLRSASALISSIDPEAAGGLLHELSLALEGRSESLRSLTRSFDEITGSLVTRTEQLDRLAENSTRLTKVFADHRLSLSSSLTNLRDVAQTLRDANGDIQVLLDEGPDFLGTTADLVSDQKRNLDCMLHDLGTVTSALGQDGPVGDLAATIRNGPTAFGYVASAVDHDADGPWIRVNLTLSVDAQEAPQYVPRKSLPVVPTVSTCASPLTPAAVAPAGPANGSQSGTGAGRGSAGAATEDAAGTRADARERGPMALTGGEMMLALAAGLLVAGLVVWRLRRT
jgi:phospholipid/cholesterol/gamma-HCH transport system substrate-binding protein